MLPQDEQAAQSEQAEPEKPKRPARAYNDPREVRRRQREAELKAQGVISKGADEQA